MSDLRAKKNTRYWVFIGLFLLAGAILVSAALAIPSLERLNAPSVRVGQVAPQDFLADQALSYPSQILTEQKREAAAQAVPAVYTRPDTSIARKQLEQLQSAAAFISSVRGGPFCHPGTTAGGFGSPGEHSPQSGYCSCAAGAA